jgi:hypothetical protein
MGWTPANIFGVQAGQTKGTIALTCDFAPGVRARVQALNLVAWVATLAQLSEAEIALARRAVEDA